MTEQDYINATALGQLRVVSHILHEIIPGSTPGVTEEEHRQVAAAIRTWIDALSRTVQEP